MGMTVNIATASLPAWDAVIERMAARGVPVQMRLIDGQPAFPDETPPPGWRELRVANAGRMVTIRRSASGVELVTWGNADDAALAFRDALAQALAEGTET